MKMDTAAILLYAVVTLHGIGASLIKSKENGGSEKSKPPLWICYDGVEMYLPVSGFFSFLPPGRLMKYAGFIVTLLVRRWQGLHKCKEVLRLASIKIRIPFFQRIGPKDT